MDKKEFYELIYLDQKLLSEKLENMDEATLKETFLSLAAEYRNTVDQLNEVAFDKLQLETIESSRQDVLYSQRIDDLKKKLADMEAMYEEAQGQMYDLRLENERLHQEIEELENSHPGGRRKKTSQEKQELIEYIEDGHTQKQAAERFKMSTSTVHKILVEAGMVDHRN